MTRFIQIGGDVGRNDGVNDNNFAGVVNTGRVADDELTDLPSRETKKCRRECLSW